MNSRNFLSNNFFDTNSYSKKEIIEITEYFIRSAQLISKIQQKNKELDIFTYDILNDLGIEQKDLDKFINIVGEKLFEELISTLNVLKEIDYLKCDEINKYFWKYRQKKSKIQNNNYTFIDLFCGAGGMSYGLTLAGFTPVLSNDIDKDALRTYLFNHPEMGGNSVYHGDVTEVLNLLNDNKFKTIDAIIGGPPCQGFSNANRQRIIDDPRNILYKYFVESLKIVRPKFFIMENVRGMKSVAEQVVQDINSKCNNQYKISYKVLNAVDFEVPQNRQRLIFIGIRNDIINDKSIDKLFEIIEDNRLRENYTLRDAIYDLKPLQASRIKNNTKGDILSGFPIEKNGSDFSNEYVKKLNLRKPRLTLNHKARFNNDRDIEIYSKMEQGDDSSSPRISDIMPYKNRENIFKDKYFKLIYDKPCKTITAHMKFDCNMYIHPEQARGLTPREAARIQSYPDNYLFLGAFTKTYQQIGNSVPPLMSKYISNTIKLFIEG
ncbi:MULTISPECIES: DNA cytosine methyltransferase [Macrococcoides]|uniref:DNA cytosine methyltransferase n=1 Tax=Macrococcoides TaxID=3076173 RepID=UPI00119FEB4B|nr:MULTISPECIES: DNA cytosine methyltransferase [Macrococcus]MDJ1152752.1 DNA cytosine methyltransferase [Macrococcus caseolyticus]WBF53453.1 DNA cytosine methyltransferase [Macrococcus canis]